MFASFQVVQLEAAFPKETTYCSSEQIFCFSAEGSGVRKVSQTNGCGVDNQAFEIEVYFTYSSAFKKITPDLVLIKMSSFSQEDNITDSSSVKSQTKKKKKSLGSYLR